MKPEEALDQIAYLRQLVNQSRFRISSFSPWFIMWGVLWIFGYLDTLWLPEPARNWGWPAVYLIGFVASFWPFVRRPAGPPAPELFRKLNWVSLILLGGCVAIPLVFFGGAGQHTVNAYFPFVIGLIYLANGLFYGPEIVAMGGWLVGLGVAAVWIPSPWQEITLAAFGGGGLILTGLLLRQVRGR